MSNSEPKSLALAGFASPAFAIAALAVGLVYPILDWVGFNPAGINSSDTIESVRLVVCTGAHVGNVELPHEPARTTYDSRSARRTVLTS